MKVQHILLLLGFCFFVFAAMIFRPVPIPNDENDLLVVEGKLLRVYEGGTLDVVFILEGEKTRYYVNRGLENGLTLEKLRDELVGNVITLKYPKYWTPLDPKHTVKHLTIVEYKGEKIYDEITLAKNNRKKRNER